MILTYEQQLELVAKKLATVSINGNLSTFKYAKKVMFDYLWDKYPELKECRGHTYDNTTGQIVLLPPTKSFNYLENGTWKDKPLDTPVMLFKKFNGFMASASSYKGKLIIGTTGSTKSDYAKLAQLHIGTQYRATEDWPEGYTWLFEICDPSDPHIVSDPVGAHYLGGRSYDSNLPGTDIFTPVGGYIAEITLSEALDLAKTDKGEGWMMYSKNTADMCKLKTNYYVGKKKLMRMSTKNVDNMWDNPQAVENSLPDCWKFAVGKILDKFVCNDWIIKNDQSRRAFLEEIYD